VQLISARSDETLWADRYDRKLEDVFALQSELAETVAREIAVQLTPDVAAQMSKRGPVNPEAHLEYLKGRHSYFAATSAATELGLRHVRRALELDPNLALAWSALAECLMFRAVRGMSPPGETVAEATVAANRALAIDPLLAEATRRSDSSACMRGTPPLASLRFIARSS
jgi:adenylate cyclase